MTTAEEIRSDFVTRFAPDARAEIDVVQVRATAAVAAAEQKEAEWAQRIGATRSLIDETLRLRHIARRGRELAEGVDAVSQAEMIVRKSASSDLGMPAAHWQLPIQYGASVLTMKPHLRNAVEKVEASAAVVESRLRAALADGEINVRALFVDNPGDRSLAQTKQCLERRRRRGRLVTGSQPGVTRTQAESATVAEMRKRFRC